MSDNLQKYKTEIDRIDDETKDELWTMPFATLVLLLAALLVLTAVVNLVFFSFGSWILAVLVYLIEAGALIVVLYRHRQKMREVMREKISAREAAQPGISEAYEQWRSPDRHKPR